MSLLDKLVKKIHPLHEQDFTEEEVKELLSLDAKYNYDEHIFKNKKLKLKTLEFSGAKDVLTPPNGKFTHQYNLENGVNLLLADNNMGKSTVFKLIKLALTGSGKSLKADVKKWVKDIYLEFQIDITYTIYINLEGRVSGKLFKASLEDVKKGNLDSNLILIEEKSELNYTKKIEGFFFGEFGFYRLNWTQKTSAKNKQGLSTPGTSWNTYFSSIFLESKDYNKLLFGNQNEKILEMLLGFELTYPINRLQVKSEQRVNKLSLASQAKQQHLKQINPENLQKELDKVRLAIKQKQEIHLLIEKHDSAYKQHQSVLNNKEKLQKTKSNLINKKIELEQKITELVETLEESRQRLRFIDKEKVKNQKRINHLKEELEVGKFFSNLEIEYCPNCENTVKKVTSNKTCYVCNQEMDEHKVKLDEPTIQHFKKQIQELEQNLSKLTNEQKVLNTQLVSKEKEQRKKVDALRQAQKEISEIDIAQFDKQINELDKKITQLNQQISNSAPGFADLYKKEGVIEHQIKEYHSKKKIQDKEEEKAIKEQKVFQDAISYLKKEREKKNKDNIAELSQSLLNYLHAFRVSSIEEVIVNESMSIYFRQHGDLTNFRDLSEGEQLKAKLSLYLSLINVGIKSRIGRHPKFMIIDTPGKEEGDEGYLKGLRESLKEINQKFENDVQIIVGTALRELSDITTPSKSVIKEQNEYVF